MRPVPRGRGRSPAPAPGIGGTDGAGVTATDGSAWLPRLRVPLDRLGPDADLPPHAACGTPLPRAEERQPMSDLTKSVTDDSFRQDVLEAPGSVLVDFWAEWCGPCKTVAPILDEIAREYQGRLTVAKVNIDDNPATPNEYGVRGIPTMILFRDGKQVDAKVGALPKGALKDWIAGALGD
jgi:thioredoxin 1